MLALVACGTLQVQIEPELEGANSETVTSAPTPNPDELVVTTVVTPLSMCQIVMQIIQVT